MQRPSDNRIDPTVFYEKVGTRNVDGYVAAFEEHGFDYELLDPEEVMDRWPQFRLSGSERAIYQSESGLVNSEAVHETSRPRGSLKRDGGIMVLRTRKPHERFLQPRRHAAEQEPLVRS